ncbi:nucleoporin Ndc1 [Trichogramma pretiosum]|uniref:nucleoporin Ndc1 n=1 Tax=Trichogramma pretiosum TaxID=7493 RepID=UPI0006C972A1|nr:nucleoporin Ndc1 [Trichogramma pretiosum]
MEPTGVQKKKDFLDIMFQRIYFALFATVIVHFAFISGAILFMKIKITQPLEWIQITWNVVTCSQMWTGFIVFGFIVVLLAILISKDYIRPAVYAPSRFVKFCHMFKWHNLMVGCVYMILGAVLVWLHVSVEGGKFGSMSRECQKIKNICLVEEHLFLRLHGFWIGLYFFVNSSYIGNRNLQFPIIPQAKLSQLRLGLRAVINSTLYDAIWPVTYFMGFYAIFGSYFRNFILSLFSLAIDEVPLDTLSRLMNSSLIFYAYLHTVLFVVIIQSMHLLFQAYLTEWVLFDIEQSPMSDITLDSTLTSEISIIRNLGYLDLFNVALKDKIRRSMLFTLSQPGGHPYNWNNVIGKCLAHLKHFNEELNLTCGTQKDQPSVVTKIPSTLDSQLLEKPHIYHMRSLVTPMTTAETLNEELKNKQPPTDNFLVKFYKNTRQNFINYLLSKKPIGYIFGEQFESKLRHTLRETYSVTCASDAISSLAAFSLEEDPYGIVQKDLPDIIETLLKLKQTIDKIQKMNVSIRKPLSDDRFLKQSLTALRSATRRSLYRITAHFKDYMSDLSLSPGIVDQLQTLFTYRE